MLARGLDGTSSTPLTGHPRHRVAGPGRSDNLRRVTLVRLVDGPLDGTDVRVESPALGQPVPVGVAGWPRGAYVITGKLRGCNGPVIAVWTPRDRLLVERR